jgi:hypothetical protein
MTKQTSKWDRMAEALFVDYPRRLREDRAHDPHCSGKTLVLSEAIVVNGNTFIPANTTLIIDEPARRS